MNTKLLMTASALFMGAVGIVMTFAPDEVSAYFDLQSAANLETLVFQILGALYFAFAMVNWTSKGNLIGGIYARPVAIGNLTHFVIGALALIKGYMAVHQSFTLIAALFYTVFAIAFTIVFFTHPVKDKN